MLPSRNISRKPMSPRAIALVYAVFAMLWIALSDHVLGYVIDDPSILVRFGSVKGYVFVAITSALLYLLLSDLRESAPAEGGGRQDARLRPLRLHLMLIFIALAIVVPLVNYGVAQIYGLKLQAAAGSDLRAIAELKAGSVESWLDERRQDAEFIASSEQLIASADAWLYGGDMEAGDQVATRLKLIENTYGYRVELLDRDGRAMLPAGSRSAVVDDTVSGIVTLALDSGMVQTRDLYRDSQGAIQLDFHVPLVRGTGTEQAKAIGVIVMHTPVEGFLYPLIETWPTLSPSAESFLVRREGNDVLYLNELRHLGGTALSFRLPLDNGVLPAARAVVTGEPADLLGVDYRGVAVMAAVRPVNGSPWYLIAKIDHREIMAPLQQLVFWISVVAVFMVACVTAVVVLLWRRQGRSHERAIQDQVADRDRLMRNFYDMPFIGMAIIDPASRRPMHVNDRMCAMLGRSRETLLEMSWEAMLHTDDRPYESARIERVLAKESEGYEREVRILQSNGGVMEAIINVRGVSRGDGRVEFLIATMQDITERKRAELALREREADLNRAQAVAGIGSWSLDVRQNRMDWSPECHRLFGIAPGTPLSYDTFINCVHPEDAAFVEREWRMAEEGGAYDIEHRIIVDGQIRWIRERAELNRDESGQLVGVIGTSQDVTDHMKDQERLRQAATVFESTREGIMVTDAKRRIRMVNRAFCEMSGYCEDELLGQTPSLFRYTPNRREFYATMWRSIRQCGSWQGEIRDRRKDGSTFPALLSINALKDGKGKPSGYVGVYTDISPLKESEAKLEFLAHHDSLTGLPNRLLLMSRLEHSLDLGQREHVRHALLMLDLDRFKDINDSFGHFSGDEILQQVAQRLTGRLRGIDTISRLGGDEFALLLANITNPVDAERVAREIIEMLSEPCRLENGAEVRIGVSIGISLYPDHGVTPEELLQHADAALYRSKADGRGCIRYFSDELTTAARARIELDARLRRAIAQDELRVYYQPQIEISSGNIIGAEALIRWEHPERGLVSPAEFIPVAEETGLIGELGAWVLEEVCRQGSAWAAAGLPPLTLAVNLSPHQLRHGDIGRKVADVLEETGFPPERLELELTETVLMTREDEAVEVLKDLRSMGVRLAIDDFGTGFSSLAYLKRLPLDVLKIDKGFIKDIPHDDDDIEIALAIIAIAHALGFMVLAEGVETREQLSFLRKHNCDRYQGFLASKALPATEFAALLSPHKGRTRTG